jgi:hypothetical protein
MNGTDHPITVLSHFRQTSNDTAAELNELLSASGALSPFARMGLTGQMVGGPVAGALAEALTLDLGDIIFWGWQTHHSLQAAARATLAGAGPPQHVSLATHGITSVHHPQVDVIVDEQQTMTITFDLTLIFSLEALLLTVQRGLLIGLSPAGCHVEMTFGAHGMNVSRSWTYRLPDLVNLQYGLPLLPRSAYRTPATGDGLQHPAT